MAFLTRFAEKNIKNPEILESCFQIFAQILSDTLIIKITTQKDPSTFQNLIIQGLNNNYKNSEILRSGLFCLKQLLNVDFSKILTRRDLFIDFDNFSIDNNLDGDNVLFEELSRDVFSGRVQWPRKVKGEGKVQREVSEEWEEKENPFRHR